MICLPCIRAYIMCGAAAATRLGHLTVAKAFKARETIIRSIFQCSQSLRASVVHTNILLHARSRTQESVFYVTYTRMHLYSCVFHNCTHKNDAHTHIDIHTVYGRRRRWVVRSLGSLTHSFTDVFSTFLRRCARVACARGYSTR